MNAVQRIGGGTRALRLKVAGLVVLVGLALAGSGGCKNSLTGSDTGVWSVRVIAGCRHTNVQVYIDSQFVGYAQPGDSGVSMTVAVGNHSFKAVAADNTQWGPTSVYIDSNGVTTTLNCP